MKKQVSIGLLSGFVLMLVLYGCSILGLAIGSAIDKKNTKTVAGWEVLDIPKDDNITVINRDGTKIRGKFKGGAIANPAVDTSLNVVLVEVNGNQIKEVPVSDIYYVEIQRNMGKTIGFLVGLSIDATVLVLARELKKEKPKPHYDPPDTILSCPYFYSYDGSEYQLDAELFSGSFFKSAERPDWDNLDFLKETNGVYRIKMVNELEEREYVDQVQLLAVDHPKGSRVYPAFTGKIYTFTQPQAPRTARDFAGADVREHIRHNDAEYWLSNPFGRNPQKQEDLRDGVILEFDRPAGVTSAAMLLRVQNTAWTSGLLKNLLTLPGENLDQWYAEMERSAEAREAVARAMIREAMLRVYVWDGTKWRPAGHIWEVGAGIAKDVAHVIDLEDIPGDMLKIKLESTPGMWMVNSVQVDFSYYNIPTTMQSIPVSKAVDQKGQDVSLMLQKADNRYYEMPSAGDVVELEFTAPAPPPAGMDRSFILQGSGYYIVNMKAEGAPRMAELRQIVEEPGAFSRFSLLSLHAETLKYIKSIRVVQ